MNFCFKLLTLIDISICMDQPSLSMQFSSLPTPFIKRPIGPNLNPLSVSSSFMQTPLPLVPSVPLYQLHWPRLPLSEVFGVSEFIRPQLHVHRPCLLRSVIFYIFPFFQKRFIECSSFTEFALARKIIFVECSFAFVGSTNSHLINQLFT